LLFKIPIGARNNFFYGIYRQFGHTPSKKVRQPWPTVYHWHCLCNMISARHCFRLSHLHRSGSPNLPLIATVKLTNSFCLCHAASMLETCRGICEGGRHTSCISARIELKQRASVKNCTKTFNCPQERFSKSPVNFFLVLSIKQSRFESEA
jgi:hypothetical protein